MPKQRRQHSDWAALRTALVKAAPIIVGFHRQRAGKGGIRPAQQQPPSVRVVGSPTLYAGNVHGLRLPPAACKQRAVLVWILQHSVKSGCRSMELINRATAAHRVKILVLCARLERGSYLIRHILTSIGIQRISLDEWRGEAIYINNSKHAQTKSYPVVRLLRLTVAEILSWS